MMPVLSYLGIGKMDKVHMTSDFHCNKYQVGIFLLYMVGIIRKIWFLNYQFIRQPNQTRVYTM
jgi:hypothetical protein